MFYFQGTDIFAAVLFYFEGYHVQSFITIGLVFLPGFCIYISELRRSFCTKPCVSVPKAIGYLLFSPLWAIVIHIYSLCDERYIKSALYFKTLQGKFESGYSSYSQNHVFLYQKPLDIFYFYLCGPL